MKALHLIWLLSALFLSGTALVINFTSLDWDLTNHQLWIDPAENVVTTSYGFISNHSECGMSFLIVIFTFPAMSIIGMILLTGGRR